MDVYYFDASAQVKYHLTEPGSGWVRSTLDATDPDGQSSHTIFVAEISLVEVGAALASVERRGQIERVLRDQALQAYLVLMSGRYQVMSVHLPLLMEAVRLTQSHPLKGYDAVHLAAGLEVQRLATVQDLTAIFVSGDRRLLTAAKAEGLSVENPYDYADQDLVGIGARELAHAIWQLGERGDPAAVPLIIPHLGHANGNVRRMAASALGKLGDPAAVPALMAALQDPKPQIRQYAARALGRIGDTHAQAALEGVAQSDPKDYVRQAAKAAIQRLRL